LSSYVYLALLELGLATPSQIAREAKLKRPTVYVLLGNLVEKNFVAQVQGKPKKFRAEHPDKLKMQMYENLIVFERSLPWLKSLINKETETPNVRFFRGLKGIKQAYKESLLVAQNTKVLAFGSAEAVLEQLKGFIELYLAERVSKKIKVRAITQDNQETRKMLQRDKKELRETRILDPWQFNKEVEIDVYDNKILAISLEGNNSVAIILESKTIVEALRQMFEIIWRVAKPVREYLENN